MSTPPKMIRPPDGSHHARKLLCVAAIAATLASCADQPTAPSSTAATVSANAGPFDLNAANVTLEWERTARNLAAAHPAVNPLIAGRAYALVAVAQYEAAVAADDGYDAAGGGRALYEARRGAIAAA